jgi:hypothetical protein
VAAGSRVRRIDDSIATLSADGRALLWTLACLEAGLERSALGDLAPRAWDALRELLDRSLVHRSGDDLVALAPIAARARHLLGDGPRLAAARRNWLVALARDVVGRTRGFAARAQVERLARRSSDLRQELDACVRDGAWDDALDLAFGLESAGLLDGSADDRAELAASLVAGVGPEHRGRALLLVARANANHDRGRAVEAVDEALGLEPGPDLRACLHGAAFPAHAELLAALQVLSRGDGPPELLARGPRVESRLLARAWSAGLA